MNLTTGNHNKIATPKSNVIGNMVRGLFAYFALTPMIFCWGLQLIILAIIIFVSFEQTADAVAAVFALLSGLTERFPFLARFALDSSAWLDSGVIEINNSNLSDVIFGLYGYVAMPFVLLGVLLDLVRGPRPPRSLKRKIKILSLSTLAVIAVFFINVLLGNETWGGDFMVWALMFTIGPGIVWMISVVSLSLHHGISTMVI
jgi:hypothetical protein